MDELETANNDEPVKMRHFSSGHIERAIEDAENLIAYAARAGKPIDKSVFNTLVTARTKWDEDDWSNEFALEFWEAFGHLNELVKPATADSIRAICLEPKHSGFRGFLQNQYGRSEATRAITRYTVWTLFVLAIVLVFQIYWVIGNSLSIKLTELIEAENSLSDAIVQANMQHAQLEILFKLKEEESGARQDAALYDFYNSSDWERETLQLKSELQNLEEDLEALKIQLERNFGILQVWAFVWDDSIENTEIQNDTIRDKITVLQKQKAEEEELIRELLSGDFQEEVEANEKELVRLENELLELEAQLNPLVTEDADQEQDQSPSTEAESGLSQDAVQQAIRDKISDTLRQTTAVAAWLEQNERETKLKEMNAKLANLDAEIAAEEKQHERWVAKETVRRLRLSAEFLLDILQVYLLPVLYGLLGASVYVLRKIMRSIADATYFPDRSYLLRLALGTLSGLIIGWFIFLLPGQSVVSTLSPMALSFVVGYNIEIIFALMDKLIDNFTKDDREEKKEPDTKDRVVGNGHAGAETQPLKGAQ